MIYQIQKPLLPVYSQKNSFKPAPMKAGSVRLLVSYHPDFKLHSQTKFDDRRKAVSFPEMPVLSISYALCSEPCKTQLASSIFSPTVPS